MIDKDKKFKFFNVDNVSTLLGFSLTIIAVIWTGAHFFALLKNSVDYNQNNINKQTQLIDNLITKTITLNRDISNQHLLISENEKGIEENKKEIINNQKSINDIRTNYVTTKKLEFSNSIIKNDFREQSAYNVKQNELLLDIAKRADQSYGYMMARLNSVCSSEKVKH